MYVVHRNTPSDSFRIRMVWFQPKQNSDRIRISFSKNRTGSDSKKTLSDHLWCTPVLNIIGFPDRDPTIFCNSEPDSVWAGFWKNSTGLDMDIQTALITAVWCLIRVFSDINRIGSNIWTDLLRIGPDCSMKILDWIGLQKSQICSTLLHTSATHKVVLQR